LDCATVSIAATAQGIKAKSFTIDGEAVVLGPDRLSRFEELSRREAAGTHRRGRLYRLRTRLPVGRRGIVWCITNN
jgi:ATP-dependent DNA ligase